MACREVISMVRAGKREDDIHTLLSQGAGVVLVTHRGGSAAATLSHDGRLRLRLISY